MPSLRNRKVKGRKKPTAEFYCTRCGMRLHNGKLSWLAGDDEYCVHCFSQEGRLDAFIEALSKKPTIFDYVKSKCFSCGEKIVECGVFVGGKGLYFVSLQGLIDDPVESGILKGYCDFEPCYERSKI